MFAAFWNSLEKVSSAVSLVQLALILFGAITLSLTYAQYKLSLQKDFLSGTSQKIKEEALNERVTQASQDATKSIADLERAKTDLAGMQGQFTKAAKDAHQAVAELASARNIIDELRARADKIETLGLRLELTFATDSITGTEANTNYMDTAPTAALVMADRKFLMFGAQQSRGLQIADRSRLHLADLQILDQSSITGRNVADLTEYRTVAIGLGNYFTRLRLTERIHSLISARIFLRINGTEISIFDGPLNASTDNLPDTWEMRVNVENSMKAIADQYKKIMTR